MLSASNGELAQLKTETNKLELEKVKIEEILKEPATVKVKKKQLLEEVRTMLHAKSPGCGKNCSMTNSACKSHNTNKESKAGTTLQVKKTYAECVLEQPDTSIKSPSKSLSHLLNSWKKTENRGKHSQTLFNIQRNRQAERRRA